MTCPAILAQCASSCLSSCAQWLTPTLQDRSFLESFPEFAGLDFSPLSESPAHHNGASWTSKQGFFAPENVEERATWVRRWLRDRAENKIVVVAHGDILRCITDGYRSATVSLSFTGLPQTSEPRH